MDVDSQNLPILFELDRLQADIAQATKHVKELEDRYLALEDRYLTRERNLKAFRRLLLS